MSITVAMIAQFIQGEIEGDPNIRITGPARIEEGQPGTISFLADARYEEYAYTTGASVLLVSRDFIPKSPIQATLIRVDNVRQAVAALLSQFDQKLEAKGVVASQAIVDPTASLGEGTQVGRFTIIEKGAVLGSGCYIHDQVYIGEGVQLGARCLVYPGVRMYKGCRLGDDCVIHSNTVIGADGFGFTPQPDGSYIKIPQVGRVTIGNNVEIGANCTIDRATMGETVIEDGVKMDNLIHIAHNVRIGEHTVIASQVGVAGSTKVGKHCQIGGQVGLSGHLEVADRVKIQAQSGVASSIKEAGQAVFGSPAIGYNQYIKAYAVFKNLPELDKRLKRLEKKSE